MAMTFLSLLLTVFAVAASTACGGDTAAQRRDGPEQARIESLPRPLSTTESTAESTPAVIVPQNPGDRSIRRELNVAIDRDPDLQDREISFIVSNGDVNVTGIVRTEPERQRVNELALGISGVKSVANSLRVSP